MQLLASCLRAYPPLVSLDTKSFELIGVLFRSTLSLDEELSRVAKDTLLVMVAERPEQRALLVKHYAIYVTNNINHVDSSEYREALQTLFRMLHVWTHLADPPTSDAPNKTDATTGGGPAAPSSASSSGNTTPIKDKCDSAESSPRARRRDTKGASQKSPRADRRAPSRRELRRMKQLVNQVSVVEESLRIGEATPSAHCMTNDERY